MQSGLNWQIETVIHSIVDIKYIWRLGKNIEFGKFGKFCHIQNKVLILQHIDLHKIRYGKKNNIYDNEKLCLIEFFANKNQIYNKSEIMMVLER